MSDSRTEVDPFSDTPLEFQQCEEITDITTEQNSKEEPESVMSELMYAEPLTPEQIRWFYRDGVDKRWVEFCGYDSLRIENAWQNYQNLVSKNNDEAHSSPPIEKIVVKGGMYDVEIDKMKCVSIYCPGEEWEIMRGTWYYDGSWIPLETEQSKVIEEVHLNLFQKQSPSQTTSACNTPSHSYKVLYTEHFPEFHVDWHSINDVILYSEYRHSKLMRSVTSKLGFAKTTGYQLRRGYKVAATVDDKPHDIDHLVFVVHGIGQKRDTGKIIRNTTSFRDCVDWLKQKYFPNSNYRVEFFPVEWRSSLKLDGGWMGPDTRPPSPETQEVLLQRLQFPIENLFCLGSPLSVFLALRTRSPSNKTDVMPQGLCKRFYNIFHWSDPVAYRMEPLLERGYSKIEPVLIPPYGGVEGQQTMEQAPPAISTVDQTFSPPETDERDESPDMSTRAVDKGWSLWGLVRAGWNAKEDASTPLQPGQELAQRLDYVLRATLGRNYLYTVAAHTTYWSNYDVAYFVLTRLFPTLET
ncbi:phospholipase DDHD1 isoform X3 [Calliopsis andreniformis]|uniref:phospholipase DDHD1 isoform X3 n=1 Tax=Calliopsis andreniformis TaxID=337506 RepID=UPI003FCEB55E